MKYAIGCDPNAKKLKELLIHDLKTAGHEVMDYGSDDVIYANVAITVAEAVAAGKHDKGVLICGTGIGMSIAANKVKGCIAALVSDSYSAERACKSNNSNVICMGALTLGEAVARNYLNIWDNADFDWGTPSAPKVKRYMDYDKDGRS
jgi:ribose 5-phosphate isomerase B